MNWPLLLMLWHEWRANVWLSRHVAWDYEGTEEATGRSMGARVLADYHRRRFDCLRKIDRSPVNVEIRP